MACKANTAVCSLDCACALRRSTSRSKLTRWRACSRRLVSFSASATNASPINIGRPSVQRRGFQSSDGRAISVITMGAVMSTPSVSPLHQVNQLDTAAALGKVPAASKAPVATLALMVQATSPPSSPARPMSLGELRDGSGPTVRCTAQAPAQACSRAPSAMAKGNASEAQPTGPRMAARLRPTAKAPRKTPGRAALP